MKRNWAALIRDAIREHLHHIELRDLEERDRKGYTFTPTNEELLIWESEAVWPPDTGKRSTVIFSDS